MDGPDRLIEIVRRRGDEDRDDFAMIAVVPGVTWVDTYRLEDRMRYCYRVRTHQPVSVWSKPDCARHRVGKDGE